MARNDKDLAATPPMGWNSWDSFGASVTEAEVLANAHCLADLAPHGWEYVVVDIQWYEPAAASSVYNPFAPLSMDEFSRLTPATNRFPSAKNGQGFRPLADQIHALGLKFGIHAMRGIPRQAVHQNTRIQDSKLRARDIASTNSICAWNTDMYGVNPLAPGAQAYYDSVFALYAAWGVDFVKVDDMLYPYATGEIELIRRAIDASGRDMVLSLSCGPVDTSRAEHLRANAHTWRMSGDLWDSWADIVAMFDLCRDWAPHSGAGHWPDADMLPLGQIANRSSEHGLGQRITRLSPDEQITMMTLWCIFGSPLMLGCDLRALDAWTRDLLTNEEVLQMLRTAHGAREVLRGEGFIAWIAEADPNARYLAVFNTGFTATTVALSLSALDLPNQSAVTDLWTPAELGTVTELLVVEVASHGARLFKVSRGPRD